jgi:tRNA threonylcarbamoyl adenosine modification protein YjeE
MKSLAREIAPMLAPGVPLLLYGGLGAGKTTFAREIIRIITGEKGEIASPTYPLLQTYGDVYHYDFYRLKNAAEVYELDIDNALANKITIIEWPEIIEEYITSRRPCVKVEISLENGERVAEIWQN